MDLGILDEAAFISDLDYVIKSVLMPQLLTTGGRIILASTSPRSSSHSFVQYLREAEREGAYVRKTIYEDSRAEVLDRIPEWCKEAGGEESTTWKREYLCHIITDEESAIIPEFAREEVRASIIQIPEIPPHFQAYTVIDLGLIDNTAALFGYVDFKRAKRVILDELVFNGKDSKEIADAILAKEKQLWGITEEGHCKKKIRRYADAQALTIMDFNSLHGMHCIHVTEDAVEAKVNALRLDIHSATLGIHPRCIRLIQELQDAVWDKAHRNLDRSSAYGHFDAVAAACYFVRHTNLSENPYPQDYGFSIKTHLIHKEKTDRYANHAIKKAFGLK